MEIPDQEKQPNKEKTSRAKNRRCDNTMYERDEII